MQTALKSARQEFVYKRLFLVLGCGDEHDADSLDIKPPQAFVQHRDSSSSRKKAKKHSKEHKHRELNAADFDHEIGRDAYRHSLDSYKRRMEKSREERIEVDRYHARHSGGNSTRDSYSENHHHEERSYSKQYHHHQQHQQHQQQQQQQQQYHMYSISRNRQDYYDRSHAQSSYHHSSDVEYHQSSRHQAGYSSSSKSRVSSSSIYTEYSSRDRERVEERQKHHHEPATHYKDSESLELDLRSRLLSKHHKYIKGSEADEPEAKTARHKSHRRHKKVIEVLDSPAQPASTTTEHEHEHITRHKRKHKKHVREKSLSAEDEPMPEKPEKRKTPDDPELLARRAKFLAAEREKEVRKDVAREELKARRELRRDADQLSPNTVAANLTEGLNVIKRKTKDEEESLNYQRKRVKQSNGAARVDEEIQNISADSDSSSSSESEEEASEKSDRKKYSKKSDSDDELVLPESPLSIGDLTKSPKRKHRNTRHHSTDSERDSRSKSRSRNSSKQRTDSRSGSGSDDSQSESSESDRSSRSSAASRHRYRSNSRDSRRSSNRSRTSRSRSPHSTSRSRTRSRSRSRSGTRSEERDMKQNLRRSEAEAKAAATSPTSAAHKKNDGDGTESPICDEKGVPLPNYFPGIQGCRSVEEFQCLNRIEEGTYGVVYRAKDKRTNEIVALKRLKMEKEKEGFPITSLREINTLLKGQHPNIVTVREIVVGSNMDKIFIVMDYVEHDLKSLMETMKTRKQSFFPGEVKCLTQQLLRAVNHLHDNWILHRDLKTSNLLLSHKGILKVGDFGLAREYGSPLKKYTSLVVTLWYRAPELLLCSPEYSTPIDVWSVGCIFAEFLQMTPLFPGKSEIDELNRIFKELGTPNEKIWPGYKELPAVKNLLSQNSQFTEYPVSSLRKHFSDKTSDAGIGLLQGLLTYDPKQRLTTDAALKHVYFKELPLAIDPSMFPTWPAKSELGARKALASSPKPPSGGSQFKQLGRDDIIASSGVTASSKIVSGIITGNKKTSASSTGFVLNAAIDQRQLAMGPGFNLKF